MCIGVTLMFLAFVRIQVERIMHVPDLIAVMSMHVTCNVAVERTGPLKVTAASGIRPIAAAACDTGEMAPWFTSASAASSIR